MRTIENIIMEHPFFEDLAPNYLSLVAGCGRNVIFKPNQFIFREGETADQFYLIRYGRVSLDVYMPERGSVTIQTINADEVLGWSWLFPPYQWHFDARALELTRAIAFDGQCLRGKCDEDHELGYELMGRFARIIVQRLQATRLQNLDMYRIVR